jgi:hypothetical protein
LRFTFRLKLRLADLFISSTEHAILLITIFIWQTDSLIIPYYDFVVQRHISDDSFMSIIKYRASRLESPALLELIVQLLCLCLDLIAKLDASIMIVADRLIHGFQSASCVENQLLSQH